jgi:uncharacterized protein YbjT (DUF2867 family)
MSHRPRAAGQRDDTTDATRSETDMPMKIAVAGASGRLGRPLVDVLGEAGHDVVPMSRATGVDVITGEGLAEALEGVQVIIDAATPPGPDEKLAIEFFTTAARNLQREGERAGATRIVVVSIIGADRFPEGYNAAKIVQERETLAGPVPARVVRAAQFHEFVEQIVDWGRQGDVSHVPKMRTQLVAARTVAEVLAEVATDPDSTVSEVAGPRAETLADMAALLATHSGDQVRIEAVSADPRFESGALLPGPDASLAGPTFEEWLAAG